MTLMTQATQTRSIPMEAWCALAREGAAPPVTICLEGDSMRPLIRRGRDPVTIVPLSRELKKGDVVLFTLRDGRYVVHRVWKLKPGWVRTFGDNCWNPEPWFPEELVLGQVMRFVRNGRTVRLDTPLARGWGRMWLAVHPVRKLYRRVRSLAARIVKRILKVVIKA